GGPRRRPGGRPAGGRRARPGRCRRRRVHRLVVRLLILRRVRLRRVAGRAVAGGSVPLRRVLTELHRTHVGRGGGADGGGEREVVAERVVHRDGRLPGGAGA